MTPDPWRPRGDPPKPRDTSSNTVLRVLGCAGLIVVALIVIFAELLRSGRSPDPVGSARRSTKQVENRCAAIADRAAPLVAEAERLGAFYKFEGETVYVGPLFYELPIDTKQGTLLAAWCDRMGGSGFLHVRDSRTGKHIGIVSRDGLNLDLD